jgi:hypothetical protein
MTPPNDVDTTIELDCMEPPTFNGRVLLWSGDRIPQPGETVLCPVDNEEPVAGIVVGYFQAHGYLGIKLKVPERPVDDDVICVFGAEVAVNPNTPKHGLPS